MVALNWRFRPRLRFSLKALFAGLTVGCLLLGWQVEKRRRMVRVVEQLQAAGNGVAPSRAVPVADDFFCATAFDDDFFYEPNKLITRFWDPAVLPGRVSADALDENTVGLVSRLTTIQRLTLVSPEPCDEWLRHLESLADLRELFLYCPKLTDRALHHLAQLKTLETFDTTCTSFTRSAIARFRRALPNCQISILGDSAASSADYPPLNGRAVHFDLRFGGHSAPTSP